MTTTEREALRNRLLGVWSQKDADAAYWFRKIIDACDAAPYGGLQLSAIRESAVAGLKATKGGES